MGWGKLKKFVKKAVNPLAIADKKNWKDLGGVVAFSMDPTTAIPGVRKIYSKLDVTDKGSMASKGLRAADKAVGGGQGWGKLTQVAGAVVSVIPGGQAIGAGIIVAGKGLQAGAASADAKREKKKMAEAEAKALADYNAAVQQQQIIQAGGPAGAALNAGAGAGLVVGNPKPSLFSRWGAFVRARGW